jgi:ubiquinone/menaquinone biosynthesis C-methylase UbiE
MRGLEFCNRKGRRAQMDIENCKFVADSVTKFHQTIYISGWFYSQGDALESVSLLGARLRAQVSRVGFDHFGVYESLGPGLGFELQVLFEGAFSWKSEFVLRTKSGREIVTDLEALTADRISRYQSPKLGEEFFLALRNSHNSKMLDIGGRDRSGFDLSQELNAASCVVFDIVDGQNVDVVGDAHELSSYFPADEFDFVVANSVFEHLLMPWKVVLEMNKVMKAGAKALISTHQTIGEHDSPWDYWRFSQFSWDALFNERTGFRIVDRKADFESYILPFVLRRGKEDSENSVGFEHSVVVVEKTSQCDLSWPVSARDQIGRASCRERVYTSV